MKVRKFSFVTGVLVIIQLFVSSFFVSFLNPPKAYAATSPTLGESNLFSVLGGAAVTNVGTTTTGGAVGVSPGTSITGGTINATGGIHSNDASAIAAQADTVSLFTSLDQTCTNNYSSGQDLTLISPLVPGVYCSAGSFLLTGNLTLSGTGVWIFKTVSTLVTSSGSSITTSDPCNVWWRIGSAATLGTTTSFAGNIVTANVADTTALNTGATLNGRVLAQAAQTVTLSGNTITQPVCTAASSSSSSGTGDTTRADQATAPQYYCPPLPVGITAPLVIESSRISATSISLSWGPYSGTDQFIVRYGPSDGNWLYSTNVTGFSTTLNSLPANQPIWVQVAARNDCQIGSFGPSSLIGVRTGGPRLPNTGFGGQDSNTSMYLLVSLVLGASALAFIARKKS